MSNARHLSPSPGPSEPTRGDMTLRYTFLGALILLAAVSIGSSFISADVRMRDYIIAIAAALLANQMPGSTRALPPTSMRPSPRTYERIGLVCATISILAILVGSMTTKAADAPPFTIPWLIASAALLATICISVAIMITKDRQRRGMGTPPAQ